jgi:hypothetical protein
VGRLAQLGPVVALPSAASISTGLSLVTFVALQVQVTIERDRDRLAGLGGAILEERDGHGVARGVGAVARAGARSAGAVLDCS